MCERIWLGRPTCMRETSRTSRSVCLRKRITFGRLGYVRERARISGLACRHRQVGSLPQMCRPNFQVACVIAAPGLGANVALGHKLGIRAFDRDEAHAEMLGKGTLGRKTTTGRDGPILYIRANAEIQIFI